MRQLPHLRLLPRPLPRLLDAVREAYAGGMNLTGRVSAELMAAAASAAVVPHPRIEETAAAAGVDESAPELAA